jgi:hypothetical protein
MDMASAVPLLPAGGGTAAKSVFLPLIGRAADDARMLWRGGATNKELWEKAKALKVPLRPSDAPSDARFLQELSDDTARFNPNIPMLSSTEKANMVLDLPLDSIGRANALRRVEKLDMPMPGSYKMSDLIEHPELYKAQPGMGSTSVRVDFDPKRMSNRGSYDFDLDKFGLNLAGHMSGPSPGHSGPLGTVLHEAQHKIQHTNNLPGGADPSNYKLDQQLLPFIAEGRRTAGQLDPHADQQWARLLSENSAPFKLYKNSPGEQLARQVQERMRFTPGERDYFDPNDAFESIHSAVDPLFSFHMGHAARGAVKENAQPSRIADILRQWGTLRKP